jgi:hypothetical protein
MKISTIGSAIALGMTIALFGAAASGKTAKECNAEYATNKDAIKGAGQKKADFIAACKAGTEVVPTSAAPAAAAPAPTPAGAAGTKTAKECDAEYAPNKAAIKAAGQTKKDFVRPAEQAERLSRRLQQLLRHRLRRRPPRPLQPQPRRQRQSLRPMPSNGL